VWVAVPVQALAFALLHFYGTLHTVLVFLIGIALAMVYRWRGTLLAPLFVHSGFNLVAAVFFALAVHENANRATLGVAAESRQRPCRVKAVLDGSPAQDVGIEPGDVIVGADGYEISTIEDLQAVTSWKQPGDEMEVEILRDGRLLVKRAVLSRPP
jgi:S1-C subfamily serine protease